MGMADEKYCADCDTLLDPDEDKCQECGCTRIITILEIKPEPNVLGLSSSKLDVTIISPYDELYDDALHYRDLAISYTGGDDHIVRRYYRISLICFCMAAEAGINNMLNELLNLSDISSPKIDERKFLADYFSGTTQFLPKRYSNIRKRLYKYVGIVLAGADIDSQTDPINEFEDYICLSELRNKVCHFKPIDSSDVYGWKIEQAVMDAPQILKNLFSRFVSLDVSSKYQFPNWIK